MSELLSDEITLKEHRSSSKESNSDCKITIEELALECSAKRAFKAAFYYFHLERNNNLVFQLVINSVTNEISSLRELLDRKKSELFFYERLLSVGEMEVSNLRKNIIEMRKRNGDLSLRNKYLEGLVKIMEEHTKRTNLLYRWNIKRVKNVKFAEALNMLPVVEYKKEMEQLETLQEKKYEDTLKKVEDSLNEIKEENRKDITEKGIRVFSDERLSDSCKELPKYSNLLSPSSISLSPEQFKRFILATRPFLMTIFKDNLIIPKFNLFETEISFLYEASKFEDSGKMYEAVPHLKKLGPDLWQLGFCSIDGQVHLSEPGNLQPFPLMGISKLFLYALAIDLLGAEVVHAHVGLCTTRKSQFEKECIPPTDRTFRKPVNPATECGAIVVSSLLNNVALKDLSLSSKYDYIQSYIKEMAGIGLVGTDKAIFMSMMDNSSEYNSICYYLESSKALRWPHDITKDLEFYLQICSLEVDVESLSIIGATIANDGVNPFTGNRAIKEGHCQYLYNYMMLFSTGAASALWVREIGLPVAFGESGCCLLILPGVMAYSFISPYLNESGFSSKAHKYIKNMSSLYNLHPFESPKKEEEEKKLVCPYSCSMFKVVGDGDFFLMFSLIQMGMKPCAKNHLDETILHFAAATGNLKFVEFILRLCPNLIAKRDIFGNTPTKVATFFGHKAITAFLESKEEEKKQSQIAFRSVASNIGRSK